MFVVLTTFLVSILATRVSAFAATCPSGMVSYWKFDEGSGTIASDSVGANPGTLVGGTVWTTGKVGNALSFDSASWVSMSDNGLPAGSNPRTLEAWIKTSDPRNGAIFVYGTPGVGGGLFYVGNNDPWGYSNDIWISQWGEQIRTDAVNIMDGNWHHVAVVKSDSDYFGHYDIYVDGILRVSGYMHTNTVLSGVATIGSYEPDIIRGWMDQFIGQIDEVAIFNRALSAEEIQQQYQDGLNGEGYCPDTLAGLQQVINTLPKDVLSDTIKNSLTSKVDNALKSLDKGEDGAAINMLNAFINQVEAQRGKKISEEAADMLIAYANNIISKIRTG